MRRTVFFIAIACAAVAQLSLLNSLSIFGVKPDLLLAGVLAASLVLPLRYALVLSIICGIFKDLFLSVAPNGLNTVLFVLWGYLLSRLNSQISTEHILVRAVLILALSALHNLISGLAGAYAGNFIPAGIFLKILFISPLYTTLVSLLFLKLARLSALG